jgi:hypothetical protein
VAGGDTGFPLASQDTASWEAPCDTYWDVAVDPAWGASWVPSWNNPSLDIAPAPTVAPTVASLPALVEPAAPLLPESEPALTLISEAPLLQKSPVTNTALLTNLSPLAQNTQSTPPVEPVPQPIERVVQEGDTVFDYWMEKQSTLEWESYLQEFNTLNQRNDGALNIDEKILMPGNETLQVHQERAVQQAAVVATVKQHGKTLADLKSELEKTASEASPFRDEREHAREEAQRLVTEYDTALNAFKDGQEGISTQSLDIRQQRARNAISTAQEWRKKSEEQQKSDGDQLRDFAIKAGVVVAAVAATALILPVAATAGAVVAAGAAGILGTGAVAGIVTGSLGALTTGAVAIGTGTAAGTGLSLAANGVVNEYEKSQGNTSFDWRARVAEDQKLATNAAIIRTGFGGAGVANSFVQFGSFLKQYAPAAGQVFGGAWLGAMTGVSLPHAFQTESRTGEALNPDNVEAETLKLTQDKDYLNKNYTAKLFNTIDAGDRYVMDCDLHWLKAEEGNFHAYRYIPEDMYRELQDKKANLNSDYFKVDGDKIYVAERARLPSKDGLSLSEKTDEVWVELLPPYRMDFLRNAYAGIQFAKGSKPGAFSARTQFAVGPLHGGFRPNGTAETTFNFPYTSNGPTTTLRIGLPPGESASAGIGIRQQETLYTDRLKVDLNLISINPSLALNATRPEDPESGVSWNFMGLRGYIDNLRRWRVRGDLNFRPMQNFSIESIFGRIRQSYGVEFGLGGDILRRQQGKHFDSANWYLELQSYFNDYRLQPSWNGPASSSPRGLNLGTTGVRSFTPSLEIDPALQLSTNRVAHLGEKIPFLGPVLGLKPDDPAIRLGTVLDNIPKDARTWEATNARKGELPIVIRPPLQALNPSGAPNDEDLITKGSNFRTIELAGNLQGETYTYGNERYMVVRINGERSIFRITGISEDSLKKRVFTRTLPGLPPILQDRP